MTITLPRNAIQSIDDTQFGREYSGDLGDEVTLFEFTWQDNHEPAAFYGGGDR